MLPYIDRLKVLSHKRILRDGETHHSTTGNQNLPSTNNNQGPHRKIYADIQNHN